MEEEMVMVTIAKDWDYMVDGNVDRVLLKATPKQCKVLNEVCKQSGLYIEFAKNYIFPKESEE